MKFRVSQEILAEIVNHRNLKKYSDFKDLALKIISARKLRFREQLQKQYWNSQISTFSQCMFGIPRVSLASKSSPWATGEAPIDSQTPTECAEIRQKKSTSIIWGPLQHQVWWSTKHNRWDRISSDHNASNWPTRNSHCKLAPYFSSPGEPLRISIFWGPLQHKISSSQGRNRSSEITAVVKLQSV